jgi:hypothetical protein
LFLDSLDVGKIDLDELWRRFGMDGQAQDDICRRK